MKPNQIKEVENFIYNNKYEKNNLIFFQFELDLVLVVFCCFFF
jgi:hypothetical protein